MKYVFLSLVCCASMLLGHAYEAQTAAFDGFRNSSPSTTNSGSFQSEPPNAAASGGVIRGNSASPNAAGSAGVIRGNSAPQVQVQLPANTSVINNRTLQEFVAANRGKVIIINFFATWCGPCREEIPHLVKLHREMSPNDVVFMGLSLDDSGDKLKPFLKNAGITYPVFRAGQDVKSHYNVSSIPHNVIYDTRGDMFINDPGLVPESAFRDVIRVALKYRQM